VEYKLKEVLDYIHNYFNYDLYSGEIQIIDHQLDNSKIELFDGQYYMIKGSMYNDGIWKYEESVNLEEDTDLLKDEIFQGDIIYLRIPKDVLKTVEEIITWEMNNQDAIIGKFQSESFGGYSYTLKNSSSNKNALSWKDFFGKKLDIYRKLG
jgi:hypothetical protein